jgi:acyl-CoA reductase-like NAD-dependent aldehyde dehydrogenase
MQYINGQWLPAQDGGTWQVLNPATEQPVQTIPFGGAADAKAAIEAAAAAFPQWRKTNPWQRAEQLRRVADLMRERARALAATTTAESGKPLAEAAGEWTVAAQFFDWYAEEAKRAYGRTIPASRGNKRLTVHYSPLGVVGIVTAWNFPVWNLARVWAASLAAGCTFVAKPSEYTPLTAIALMQLIEEAGVMPGVANLVLGDAAAVGDAMLGHSAVRKIHFVGSTRVGKILLDGASRTHTRLSLELGGNAPALIFPDVDAAKIAQSAALVKTRNCGQVCVSPQRFIVHRSIYEQFCSTTAETLRGLRVGDGAESGSQVGPLINARQRDQVAALVRDSVAAGAKIRCGGQVPAHLPKGYFFEPTLLQDVSADNPVFRHEIFGPVMAVTPFDTENEAIALANDTEYGLAAYLWTNDLRASIRVSEALEFGIVGVNEWTPHGIEAPFGGWKHSGLGYECGEEGLHEYLEKKLVAVGDL